MEIPDNLNPDILIAINKSDEGHIISPRIRIYAKEEEKMKRIGLVKKVSLEAEVDRIPADLKINLADEIEGMSEMAVKNLKENRKLLKENGVTI